MSFESLSSVLGRLQGYRKMTGKHSCVVQNVPKKSQVECRELRLECSFGSLEGKRMDPVLT